MIITAKKRQSGLLAKGFHVGTIESVKETHIESEDFKSGEYADPTPQVEVRLKTENGNTVAWLFTKGYERFDEFTKNMAPKQRAQYKPGGKKGYAVLIATGCRVVSEAETAKAEEILANFAAAAGVADGEEIDLLSLAGSQVGFLIGDGNNENSRVKYFCEPAYAREQMDKATQPAAEA